MSLYGLKSLLFTKQRDRTTKLRSLVETRKVGRKMFKTSEDNHFLTPFKICNFFDYSKISFLWTTKPPFDKTT